MQAASLSHLGYRPTTAAILWQSIVFGSMHEVTVPFRDVGHLRGHESYFILALHPTRKQHTRTGPSAVGVLLC